VYLYGCDVPLTCFTNPGAPVSTVVSDTDGHFRFSLPVDLVQRQQYLLVQVIIGPVKCRRLLTARTLLKSVGSSASSGRAAQDYDFFLDPISEAATRLLESAGIQNFGQEGIDDVNEAVRTANATTTFGGLTLADANDKAEATAANDATVQKVLEESQLPPACVGDCDEKGRVTVDELVVGVNIALGNALLSQCDQFDKDRNGRVTVDELVTAVNNALNGCPAPPTTPTVGSPTSTGLAAPTATPTPTNTKLATTVTPGQPGPVTAAGAAIIVDTMGTIPSVIAGIIEGIQAGGAGAAAASLEGGAAGSCLSGTATRIGSFPFVSFTLNACEVATADGSVVFTGTGSVQLTTFNINISTITYKDTHGTVTRTASAQLSGSVSPTLGGSCFLTAATFTLSTGTVSAGPPGGPQTSLTFTGTTMKIDHITFVTPGCVPKIYRLTFNGPIALLTQGGAPINATLTDFTMDVDDSGNPTTFTLGGVISSPCFGGDATIVTDAQLTVLDGHNCPNGGTLRVTSAAGTAKVFYRANESVDVDTDNNGTTDISAQDCLDPELLMCLA
jgi:hypothetical protein